MIYHNLITIYQKNINIIEKNKDQTTVVKGQNRIMTCRYCSKRNAQKYITSCSTNQTEAGGIQAKSN